MRDRQFFITEVFAEGPYAGNQLATFPDAAGIPDSEMQQIARAFNFPETTFITGGSADAGFDVRIFTPTDEIPFAGHPTLGTSFLLRHVLRATSADKLTLNLGVGSINVVFAENGVLWMTQKAPVFGECFAETDVSAALGIAASDIDTRFPCQLVSTGLEFLIVPVRDARALASALLQAGKLEMPCLVFCPGGYTPQQDVQARMFAPELGVAEDPATGSANGCLAAYLVEHQVFGGTDIDLCVGQGYEINRPSQLYLKAAREEHAIRVQVGGKVSLVAEGEWLV